MRTKMVPAALSGVAALTLACGFGSDENSTSGSAGDTGSGGDSQQNQATGAKLDQPVRDGKFEFVVASVKCGQGKVGKQASCKVS
jgi:hypothetical protein